MLEGVKQSFKSPKVISGSFPFKGKLESAEVITCVPLVSYDHMTTPSCKGGWDM